MCHVDAVSCASYVGAHRQTVSMALKRTIPPKPESAPSPHVERFGFVKLYLDDLDDVLAHLKANTKIVVLRAGDAIAEVPDDLSSATNGELKSVTIATADPKVSIWLTSRIARAQAEANSVEAQRLAEDVARMLRRRRAWTVIFGNRWLWQFSWPGLFLIFIAVASSIAALFVKPASSTSWIGLVIDGGFGLLMLVLGLIAAGWAGGALVVPLRRADQRADRRAVRTQWGIGIVTAIVGAVIGSLITWLLAK